MTEKQAAAYVRKEVKRLTRLLTEAGVKEARQKALAPVIENLAFMRMKLDAAREQIGLAPLVIEYDNGGGQSGKRENPLFKAYENLWRSYMAGVGRILEALPEEVAQAEAAAQPEKPATVLEMVLKQSGRASG